MDKIFVVHEHHASHLHWDLRIEENGLLTSFALPKEPPLEQGKKNLAVKVEDHPISYARFEGIIPKGHYGAGTVKIWDGGKYNLIKKDKSKYVLNFTGKKLNGEYTLLKFAKSGENNWLFFKNK
ncbi:MAG: DNA polymerase ligase N-terminal domain-containing protein [bacterium]